MRLSRYFLPLLKETPTEAQVTSHRLMLRAGMVRQLSAGIYNWLPLGHTVLTNIANIIRDEHAKAGVLEMLMPTMQPKELWVESGRGDYCGKETLHVTDRHDRVMLYGPTNEEVITDIVRKNVRSYKELPLNLYHIQWKFRDEIRPRFGVMRGREFLMKDAYSFDADTESAVATYDMYYDLYLKIFSRMGLHAIPVRADTGPIGGDLSHEFHIVAETGESAVYYDAAFDDLREGKVQMTPQEMRKLYAAADEMHDASKIAPERLREKRGIEVGHIFHFGTKYTESMGAKVVGPDGESFAPICGSYGIGVSRLVGAIIESSNDEAGIIWPEAIAPFKVGLINLKPADAAGTALAESMYNALAAQGVTVLMDDTEESPGKKFAGMDLIGLPWQLTVGPRGAASGTVELKNRKTGEKVELSCEAALAKLIG